VGEKSHNAIALGDKVILLTNISTLCYIEVNRMIGSQNYIDLHGKMVILEKKWTIRTPK
jgi:hypothetical protein